MAYYLHRQEGYETEQEFVEDWRRMHQGEYNGMDKKDTYFFTILRTVLRCP